MTGGANTFVRRWVARLILDARGTTAGEAAVALTAPQTLRNLRTRDVAAQTLRRIAKATASLSS
jgi:hypothetical protein